MLKHHTGCFYLTTIEILSILQMCLLPFFDDKIWMPNIDIN